MSKLTDDYIKHALKLIRVSNGLNADANFRMRQLARDLKKLLKGSDIADMNLGQLRKLIAEADGLIYDALEHIGNTQSAATAELVSVEAKWANRIASYETEATDSAITRAINGLLVKGTPLDDHFTTIADRLSQQVASQIRLGAGAGQSDADIAGRVAGLGLDNRGGVLEGATRNVRGLVDSSTQAAASAGRRATQAANGVTALQWSAKLDAKVCPNCGERDGKIWQIDGDPVNTDIPYAPAPLHDWCRCIELPMELTPEEIDDAPETETFADWLETQSDADQNEILGNGRADLWRDGKISTSDLIGQNGLVLSLGDLRDSLEK